MTCLRSHRQLAEQGFELRLSGPEAIALVLPVMLQRQAVLLIPGGAGGSVQNRGILQQGLCGVCRSSIAPTPDDLATCRVGLIEDQGLNGSDIQSQFGFASKDKPQAEIGNGDRPWEPGLAT